MTLARLLIKFIFMAGLTALPASGVEQSTLAWTNQTLTVSNPGLPAGKLEIWYPEAFCKKGSRNRVWGETTWPHKTTLLSRSPDGGKLELKTMVRENVEVRHQIEATAEGISLQFDFENKGEAIDLEWFQPACIRVADFTGANQNSYTARSFIFTTNGFTLLNQTRRTEEALYKGGQVYVPKGINLDDVNPRPVSLDQPTNGLIGCVSADLKMILATASSTTHELFEGVYVCLHSDPHVGGLKAGEKRRIHARIYFMPNDVLRLNRTHANDVAEWKK